MIDQLFSEEVFSSSHAHRVCTFIIVLMVVGFTMGCDAVNVHYSEAPDVQSADEQPESFTRADLYFEPVSVSPGETFSIDLIDHQHDTPVAQIIHERTSDDELLLTADSKLLQTESVAVECRNQKTVVDRKETQLASLSKAKSNGLHEMTTTDREPSSYHFYDDGETVLVDVDYENDGDAVTTGPGQALVQLPSSDETLRCTHVSFVLNGISREISANEVQFAGAVQQPTFRDKEFRTE